MKSTLTVLICVLTGVIVLGYAHFFAMPMIVDNPSPSLATKVTAVYAIGGFQAGLGVGLAIISFFVNKGKDETRLQ
jgi:hypothetical protein